MDKDRYNDAIKNFEKVYFDTSLDSEDSILKEYIEFSRFIQGIFISEKGYIIDTGNFQTANMELIHRIKEHVEKHPLIWKLLFEVA